jgi:hypothetical protein
MALFSAVTHWGVAAKKINLFKKEEPMWSLLAAMMATFFMVLGAGPLATIVFSLFSVFCFLVLLVDNKLFKGSYSGVKDGFYLFCEFVGMLGNICLLAISLYYW